MRQVELAQRLGISKSYLSMILSGQRQCPPGLAGKLSSLGVVNFEAKFSWCRGGDLNSYELTLTTPSRWRVYQVPPPRQWQGWQDLNPRPTVLETVALPG